MPRKAVTTERVYADRSAGGLALAELVRERSWVDPVVLGLARGGVPVAAEVASALHAPLGVAVSRTSGSPGHPEFGTGAVPPHGPRAWDERRLDVLGPPHDDPDPVVDRERREALRSRDRYQGARAPERLEGRDVIVVDAGLATGVTARAAWRSLRESRPR